MPIKNQDRCLKLRSGYDSTNLVSIIKYHKPDILIGAVGKAPGCFTEDGGLKSPMDDEAIHFRIRECINVPSLPKDTGTILILEVHLDIQSLTI